MSDREKSGIELERQKLQDDIQRIKHALQIEGALEESDEESRETGSANLFIDTDCEDIENTEFTEQPSTSHHDYHVFVDDEKSVAVEPGLVEMQLGDVEHLPANPENCLALNRAYQEVLIDMLRRVEETLVVNREKQKSLEDNDNRESGSKEKDSCKRKLVFLYAIPYFKDTEGNYPPVNEDVKTKKALKEHKQDVLIASQWQSHQRKALLSAVRIDALEKLLRGPMNRLEILHEKLFDAPTGSEERKTLVDSISKLEEHISELKKTPAESLLLNVDPEKVDWMKISNRTFQGKRDTISCQYMWQNVINPVINRDSWSEQEEKDLEALVTKYDGKYWKNIAKELATNRTAFQCLQHYQQHLNPAAINKSEWTQEEDELLSEVVESCRSGSRISWNQVAYYIEGRSSNQCFTRWSQTDPAMKRGKWSEEEDCMLMASVHLLGMHDWTRIKMLVHGRSAAQCRERFCNSLDPALIEKPTKWTYEEDKKLLQQVAIDGYGNWSKISTQLQGRTDNNVLHRYRRLQEWQKRSDWLEKQPKETQEELMGITLEEFNTKLVKNFDKRKQKKLSKASKAKKWAKEKARKDAFYDNDEEEWKLLEEKTGIEMHDYIKQKQDKETGGLVVPRPPLRAYSSRSFLKMWERRVSLQKLIQAQIQKSLGEKHGMSDIQEIATSAVSNLENLRLLSSDHWRTLINHLRHKRPCDISVKQILDWSNKFVTGKMKTAFNKTDKLKEKKKSAQPAPAIKIHNLLRTLIEMKSTDILASRRKRKGRPRRFCIFSTTSSKSKEILGADEEQEIAVSTMGLLLKALAVNVEVILQNAKVRTVTQQGDASCSDDNTEEEALEMLRTLFKSSKRSEIEGRNEISKYMTSPCETDTNDTNVKDSQQTQGQAQKVFPAKKVMFIKKCPFQKSSTDQVSFQTISYTEIDPSSPCASSRVGNDKSQQQVKRTPVVAPCNISTQLMAKVPQTLTTNRSTTVAVRTTPVTDLKIQAVRGNVIVVKPTEDQLKKIKDYQEKIVMGLIPPSRILKQGKRKAVENENGVHKQHTMGKQMKMCAVNIPVSGFQRTTIRKGKLLPFLPPNVTNLGAFKILLLQRRLTIAKAGPWYNPFLYKGSKARKSGFMFKEEKGQIPKDIGKLQKESIGHAGKSLSKAQNNDEALENGQTTRRIHYATQTSQAVSGRQGLSACSIVKEAQNNDPLASIRETDEYILLRARFQALFSWPALLSTIYPPVAEVCRDKTSETSEKNTCETYADRIEESVRRTASLLKKGKDKDKNKDKDKGKDKDEKKVKKEKKKYKRKRYPCTGTKMFYKNLIKSREWKTSVQERRIQSREKNQMMQRGLIPTEEEEEEEAETYEIGESVSVEIPEPKDEDSIEDSPTESKKRTRGRPKGTKTKKKPKSNISQTRRKSERISTRACVPEATTPDPLLEVHDATNLPSSDNKLTRSNIAADMEVITSNVTSGSSDEEIFSECNAQTTLPYCARPLDQLQDTSQDDRSDQLVPLVYAKVEQLDGERQSTTIAMPLFRLGIENSMNNQMQSGIQVEKPDLQQTSQMVVENELDVIVISSEAES